MSEPIDLNQLISQAVTQHLSQSPGINPAQMAAAPAVGAAAAAAAAAAAPASMSDTIAATVAATLRAMQGSHQVGALPTPPAPMYPTTAPGTAVPLDRDVSVMEMNPDQVHALMRKKGMTNPNQPYHPLNRAARREVRSQVLTALSDPSRRFSVKGGR